MEDSVVTLSRGVCNTQWPHTMSGGYVKLSGLTLYRGGICKTWWSHYVCQGYVRQSGLTLNVGGGGGV